jgi:hypothetical protein
VKKDGPPAPKSRKAIHFARFLSPGRRAWPLRFREGFWPGFQAGWSEKTGV